MSDIRFPTDTPDITPVWTDRVLLSQTASGWIASDAALSELPISTAAQTALDAKLDDSQLDTDGTLSTNSDSKIASQKATKTYVDSQVSGVSTPDATSSVKGKLKLTGDLGGTADNPTVPWLANKVDTSTTVNGHALSGNVTVTAGDVWLGNVDNTSDLNKPISTATQTALNAKVDGNASITGATKTKITYDSKGLVTSWADATTADIADSTNKRYVTDAELAVLASTSGTNTGDQTITLTGDVTGSGTGSFATTLANTAVTPWSYTNTNITVDSKGRITAASNGSGGGGSGTVTNVSSADANATVANQTTTPVITVVSAPKLQTARTINGTSFDGTANIVAPAILEDKTSDYTANSTNSGKMWMRSDASIDTVKGVIKSYSTPVKQFQVDTDWNLTTWLVSYYKLEDSTDYYGSNNWTSTSTTFTAGKVNNAATYTGSGYTTLFNPTFTNKQTISLWVKIDSVGSGNVFILSDNGGYNGFGCFYYTAGTNKFIYIIRNGASPTYNSVTAASSFSTGVWYHLIGEYDGSTISLYINNSLSASASTSGNIATDTPLLQIGATANTPSLIWQVDELWIWTRDLSANNRADLYNAGSGQTMVTSGGDVYTVEQFPTKTYVDTQDATKVPYTGATQDVDIGEHTMSVTKLHLDNTPTTGTLSDGDIYWNATDKTANIVVDAANSVELNVGQEQYVRGVNKTGVQINDGQVVYINLTQGNRPKLVLAQANSFSTSTVIGVATQNIADNAEGFVTTFGVIHGYNTSSFTAGDTLYLSASTAGLLTNVLPSSPNYNVVVGKALDSTNNGHIFISTQMPLDMDGTFADNSDLYATTAKATKTYVDTVAGTKAPATSGTAILKGNNTGGFSNAVAGAGGDYTNPSHDHLSGNGNPLTEGTLSLSDVTTANATTARHGFLPKLSNSASEYLNGQGNFATPSGTTNSFLTQTFTAQTSVNVVHNLGTYPIVQVMDNTNALLIPLSVTHNTTNDFTVTFASSTTGRIVASVGSPQPASFITVSSNYSILTTDQTVNVSSGNITLTLPTAVGSTGRQYWIKNSGNGTVTLATTSSQTIDWYATGTITLTYLDSLFLQSDGANWILLNF